jgi:hypothetical protein
MYQRLLSVSFLLLAAMSSTPAVAEDYYIATGRPPTGSIIPPNKTGLGIKVPVYKAWDKLTPQEQQVWREYTELTDLDIIPPFPSPNIASFLRKLETPEKFRGTEDLERQEDMLLIVRVDETGTVTTVEIMEGTNGAKKLSDTDRVLAYVYVKALLDTKFTPAMLKGQAVASAFPMRISRTVKML